MLLNEAEREYLDLIRNESDRRFQQKRRAKEQARAAPPLAPGPPKPFEEMPFSEQVDYLGVMAVASVARYGGRPDLLLEENPHRDFRRVAAEERIKRAECRLMNERHW